MGVAVGTELRVKLTAAWSDLENVRVALLASFPGLPRFQFLINWSRGRGAGKGLGTRL